MASQIFLSRFEQVLQAATYWIPTCNMLSMFRFKLSRVRFCVIRASVQTITTHAEQYKPQGLCL
jgi:hypothetical protein